MSLVTNDNTDEFDFPEIDESHPSAPQRQSAPAPRPETQVVEPREGASTPSPAPVQVAPTTTAALPKATKKPVVKKESEQSEDTKPFSARVPVPLRREILLHTVNREETIEEFVPRALLGQLEREKDRIVSYEDVPDDPESSASKNLKMFSTRVEASVRHAVRVHTVTHGEYVQAFAIRAFTEQLRIEKSS